MTLLSCGSRRLASRRYSIAILASLLFGITLACWPTATQAAASHRWFAGGDITGQVVDSATGAPLQSASVSVMRGTQIVFRTSTDAFGRFTAHNISAGAYTVIARLIGFSAVTKPITVTGDENLAVDFRLSSAAAVLEGQSIQASVPLTIDTRSGDQQFQQDQYHGAPTTTTSQIVQQSVLGAARAPTGEVHIRGQHAEYSYYIDGVPVPSGISGSLNELFDPSVVSQIDFLTGGWDAEYGNKNAAVIDVATRIPTGAFHMNVSGYGGSFNTNGQAANVSGNAGKFGYFLSGARQVIDMREEPVDFDTTHVSADQLSQSWRRSLRLWERCSIPPSERRRDAQRTGRGHVSKFPMIRRAGNSSTTISRMLNGFVNLGWHHHHNANELFAGLFYRYGTLRYTPGARMMRRSSSIRIPPRRTVCRRTGTFTTGMKVDYTYRPRHGLEFKVGTLSSITRGQEDFSTLHAVGCNRTGLELGALGE